MTNNRATELARLLESYDMDTLGDDPAEFDEWLALYDERERLLRAAVAAPTPDGQDTTRPNP